MTKREAEVYNFIKNFISENHYSPTVREIARGIYSNSLHNIHDILNRLKDKGFIDFKNKLPRTITIIK